MALIVFGHLPNLARYIWWQVCSSLTCAGHGCLPSTSTGVLHQGHSLVVVMTSLLSVAIACS